MNTPRPLRHWFDRRHAQAVPVRQQLFCNPEMPAGWEPQRLVPTLEERSVTTRPGSYHPSLGPQTRRMSVGH